MTPREATNLANDPHVFTVLLEVDRGSGFEPFTGEVVDLDSTGVGSIVRSNPIGPVSTTCRTDATGTCAVTVNSPIAGSLTLTASYTSTVDDVTRTYSATGVKTWTPTAVTPALPPTGGTTDQVVAMGAILLAMGLALRTLGRHRGRPTPDQAGRVGRRFPQPPGTQ